MDLFSGYVWIFLSHLVETLFWICSRIFMRYTSHEAINSTCSSNLCHENYHDDSNNSETKIEAEEDFFKYSEDEELKTKGLEEITNAIKFKQECSHQNESNGSEPEAKFNEDCSETVTITNCAGNLGLDEEEEKEKLRLVFKFRYQTWKCCETFDSVNTDNVKASESTNKHEFLSSKSFSSFLDEPCVCSEYFPLENDSVDESERNFEPESCERRCVDAAVELKTVPSVEQADEHLVENLNNNVLFEKISADNNFLSEDDFICESTESNSMISSIGDEFLSDTDFGTTTNVHTLGNHDEENAVLTKEDLNFEGEKRSESFDAEDRDTTMVRIRRLEEETIMQDTENIKLKGNCFQDRHGMNLLHSSTGSDLEDSYRFDAQWEHQDLIEQLKIELNKVRDTGLPTTFETQRIIMEDLKPWEIDEKFKHGSAINDLTKFYKSYTERMRKFDILNYQKLFAIGALKTKDLVLSFSSRENSSTLKKFMRRKKSDSDPLKKFVREFYSDLEMAYVGQLCLSWDFLQLEYEKALQLWESDQCRFQSYNEVAEEFQHFQVLLLRFIENERFQGPRVEYYARNRCAMQNFLQVPVIREDKTKEEEKFKTGDADKDEITIDMLVEILEESIKIISRFIRADKDASSLAHKGPRETQVKLQDPADSEFLREIQAELRKKEKRLNELLKRSSIMKKFQKHEEDGRDHLLYFFPQVDMKLVWRVLNMSKISRDQLAWCHNKLSNINFVNRSIHIEPSFLLFPC
ncbi:hypothetical protein HKD37_19G052606 [Glycine soja]